MSISYKYMSTEPTKEVIFIGLPGLTHHYGGLSPDNIASDWNRGSESNPRQAALQVIALARYILSSGIMTAILPPQLRPYLPALQEAGFSIETAPIEKLVQASSSSFMWAANAATVTPASDSADSNLHITTANLYSNPHRRIEAQVTHRIISQIFSRVPNVVIHPPLDAMEGFLDEGAANNMRLAPAHNAPGLHVFVYGRRQNMAASKAVAANHNIPAKQTLFLEQNPEVISKGVFHNDVIAVNNENLLLVHIGAYANGLADIALIEKSYSALHPQDRLRLIIIGDDDLSVEEAVHSYFFNSQLVTGQDGKMTVIAPMELQTLYSGKAAKLMEKICAAADNPINDIEFLDLRQSMRNGGGPACLRLRVPLTNGQVAMLGEYTGVLADEMMLSALEKSVKKYYPETLTPEGLRNMDLYNNSKEFLAEISQLMRIILV